MSHITCPKCQSKEHTQGYGLGMGPMGSYTICDGCDTMLEFAPDLEGLTDAQCERIVAEVARWRLETWGPSENGRESNG